MINLVKMMTYDEGLKYRVYLDTTGKHTVGIGFNMDDPHAETVWRQADIRESFDNVYHNLVPLSTRSVSDLFNTCVNNAKHDLRIVLPTFDTFPACVQLALVNLMFNLGLNSFKSFDETIKMLKDGRYTEAATHLLTTKWARDVKTRAKRVTELMQGNDIYSKQTKET